MNFSSSLSWFFFSVALLSAFLLTVFMSLVSKEEKADVPGEKLELRYSSLLGIIEGDGYTVVDISNPWDGSIMHRYVLVPKTEELPALLPEGTLLRTPVSNMLVFSGVHVALLEELGSAACVKAVCDAEYIYSEMTASAISKGDVVDCGSSMNVDLERVAEVSPEAILVLPYENGGYGKLGRSGVPLVECADYMESSPLGCAEWVRFYGRLVGKAEIADSIFNAVRHDYEALSVMASNVTVRPKLLCELMGSSAWYLPAGESTMGRIYSDAGADYIFSYTAGTGSVPLSFETVLEKASDADVWLVKYNSPVDKTYTSLLAEHGGYIHFRPFEERNIYVCNTKYRRIFEERSFHPEILLKELVALFHPELFPEYKLKYYERMR